MMYGRKPPFHNDRSGKATRNYQPTTGVTNPSYRVCLRDAQTPDRENINHVALYHAWCPSRKDNAIPNPGKPIDHLIQSMSPVGNLH